MTWAEESKSTPELEAQFAGAALFMAAQNNELADVRGQIESGVDPNSSMSDGLTPLFMAVANNRVEMANLLLDKAGGGCVRTAPATERRHGASRIHDRIPLTASHAYTHARMR